MLWLLGSVPDLGHLHLQTKEPKLLLCFLWGLLNTAGQWSAGTCWHWGCPFPEGGDPVGRDMPGPRKPPCLGDGSLWLEHGLWEMEPAHRHWESAEHPLHPWLSERLMCRALDEIIVQRWKAKATSVLWVWDTTATQWTCPKKVKLGGVI